MTVQLGFRDVGHRLEDRSRQEDPLAKMSATVEFAILRLTVGEILGSRNVGRRATPVSYGHGEDTGPGCKTGQDIRPKTPAKARYFHRPPFATVRGHATG